MGIEINGLNDLFENLGSIADTINLAPTMNKAVLILERAAKQKARHGNTGLLKTTIKSEVEVSEADVKGIVYSPLAYAPYVEFGTGLFAVNGNGRKDVPWHYQTADGEWHSTNGQAPQPFMLPAINEKRSEIINLFNKQIKNQLEDSINNG